MPQRNYLLGFFSFKSTSSCLFLSLHPEDFILLYGLLLKKELFALWPPIHHLSLCRELSCSIPLPWNLLFKVKNFSVLLWKPFQWSLLRCSGFFSKFYFTFLLRRWSKMHAVFKISMDSCNSLMGFSFFFFFPLFCSFYPFLTLFCLPFWPPLSTDLTFSQNYSQWVQDPSWAIIGNLEHITVYV